MLHKHLQRELGHPRPKAVSQSPRKRRRHSRAAQIKLSPQHVGFRRLKSRGSLRHLRFSEQIVTPQSQRSIMLNFCLARLALASVTKAALSSIAISQSTCPSDTRAPLSTGRDTTMPEISVLTLAVCLLTVLPRSTRLLVWTRSVFLLLPRRANSNLTSKPSHPVDSALGPLAQRTILIPAKAKRERQRLKRFSGYFS